MELLEYKNKLFELLKIEDISQLPKALEKITDNQKQRYIELFGLDRDWIRELYQYYLADRDGLKQDYTPESLAKLLGRVIGKCDSIIDLCAGSGSLSLHTNSQAYISAYELDQNVLPFLKFNLLIHGRKFDVYKGNVLAEDLTTKADGVLSNPPFNLPNNGSATKCKTGNWAFASQALSVTRNRAAVILPVSVLKEEKDKNYVSDLIARGNIEAVIKCPGSMFASTSIPVCVIVMNANSQNEIVFVDASRVAKKESRMQRGQFGGTSHTGRVYKKYFYIFEDDAIEKIISVINHKENTRISKVVKIEEIKKNEFNLNPQIYLLEETKNEQTKLQWITQQYNAIIRQKNDCKVTINVNLAREIGLDPDLWEQQKTSSSDIKNMIGKLEGIQLEKDDYLTFTKNRELTIRFKSKDELPEIFKQFMQMWITRVVLLNNLENGMLAQMRDYLLPILMNGEIDLEKLNF